MTREQLEARVSELWDQRVLACCESLARSGRIADQHLDATIEEIVHISEASKAEWMAETLPKIESFLRDAHDFNNNGS